MIQRIRAPQGDNRDIDHGPGPVGNTRGVGSRALGAVLLADAIPPKVGYLIGASESKKRAQREWRRRQRGEA